MNLTFFVKSVFSFFFSLPLSCFFFFFLGRCLGRERVFFLFYSLVIFYKLNSHLCCTLLLCVAGSGGDSEVQRTMLELLNQLDGFEATKNIKVTRQFVFLNAKSSIPTSSLMAQARPFWHTSAWSHATFLFLKTFMLFAQFYCYLLYLYCSIWPLWALQLRMDARTDSMV